MFYRFKSGAFIKAESFDEAKKIFIKQIQNEKEDIKKWYNCTCLGFSHKHNCPEMEGIIPY